MIINITIPKHWGQKTVAEYKKVVKEMAAELKRSINDNPSRFRPEE